MQIFVDTHTSETITLDVEASNTIGFVKASIQNKTKASQKLTYFGKYLEDDHTLNDYNITDYSTLYVVSELAGQ